jgi:cobyrinic acid a,c-diamide synthase
MLGFLDLITSFHERKLNLGYRKVSTNHKCKYFDRTSFLTGHEYHYSTIIKEEGEPLFLEKEKTLSTNGYGLIKKNVFGSFLHLIDQKLK